MATLLGERESGVHTKFMTVWNLPKLFPLTSPTPTQSEPIEAPSGSRRSSDPISSAHHVDRARLLWSAPGRRRWLLRPLRTRPLGRLRWLPLQHHLPRLLLRLHRHPRRLEGDPPGPRLQSRPPRGQEGGGQGGGRGRPGPPDQRRAHPGAGGEDRHLAPRGAQQRQLPAAFPAAGGRRSGPGEGGDGERGAHCDGRQGGGEEAAQRQDHRDLRLKVNIRNRCRVS